MAQNPIVTIEMENGGVMKAELYPDVAPNTVNNFISLVSKGFYNGLTFHRVIPGFMIQGGCPDGTGMGGPGYCIKGEFAQNRFPNDLAHDRGVLSMARTMRPDSAGSQFFIMVEKAPHLDGEYAECMKAEKRAMEVIDMTKHQGAHPRMGATDVIPFVPTMDMTVEECVEMSKRLGQRIWDELKIPSFLYEDSATRPERRNLATCRKGQFEGMPEKLLQPEWAPDFGERKIHPTAGITAIGARMPLIAYNINLDTPNVEIASAIAKTIRNMNGGFRYCKAMGVHLEDRNLAQVSMNLTDFTQSAMYRVFETVKMEARRYGVNVLGSEIVGLVPQQALLDCAAYYLQLEGFNGDQVLENRL